MNLRIVILILVLAVAALTLLFPGSDSWLGPEQPQQPGLEEIDTSNGDLVVRGVEVRDLDGQVAWRGDVDLAPELARIAAGERDPHRNDGGVFQNREGLLPDRPRGHYREYVVRTPGIPHAGPQRLVIGADGAVYYTHDHYRSFRRIR